MRRRDFIKTATLSTAALALERVLPAGETPERLKPASSSNAPVLLKRSYGKAGIQISIVGLPGLMLRKMEQEHANRLVAEAVERGVNYFDVAPAYGNAEITMGPALQPYRKNVFLSCKTYQRTREGMESELKRSLERLKTDYFDLYQMHNLADVKKDVDVPFSKDGAMETLMAAKKDGRIRHIGFSAHTVEAALAAMERYDFDSIMFPFNFASYLKANFGPQVMEMARKKNITRIAIKACIRGKWASDEERKRDKEYGYQWYQPLTSRQDLELPLRFMLSQPITTALSPSDERLYRMALDVAMQYKPVTADEEGKVKELANAVAAPLFPQK